MDKAQSLWFDARSIAGNVHFQAGRFSPAARKSL
jgi:hypothetical protein